MTHHAMSEWVTNHHDFLKYNLLALQAILEHASPVPRAALYTRREVKEERKSIKDGSRMCTDFVLAVLLCEVCANDTQICCKFVV